jgi:hypothetical protein
VIITNVPTIESEVTIQRRRKVGTLRAPKVRVSQVGFVNTGASAIGGALAGVLGRSVSVVEVPTTD